jgi:hypothetical protein
MAAKTKAGFGICVAPTPDFLKTIQAAAQSAGRSRSLSPPLRILSAADDFSTNARSAAAAWTEIMIR